MDTTTNRRNRAFLFIIDNTLSTRSGPLNVIAEQRMSGPIRSPPAAFPAIDMITSGVLAFDAGFTTHTHTQTPVAMVNCRPAAHSRTGETISVHTPDIHLQRACGVARTCVGEPRIAWLTCVVCIKCRAAGRDEQRVSCAIEERERQNRRGDSDKNRLVGVCACRFINIDDNKKANFSLSTSPRTSGFLFVWQQSMRSRRIRCCDENS